MASMRSRPLSSSEPLSSGRSAPLVLSVLGILQALPSIAAGQHFPPFDPYYPSSSSVSVLPSVRDPRRVEVRARFRWGDSTEEASQTSVGFPPNAALEIELRFRRRGYLMPPDGRDWHIHPEAVGVTHNLPGYVYVDVWNYSVPDTSPLGRYQAGASVVSQCYGLEAVLSAAHYVSGVPLPPAYANALAWTSAAVVFTQDVPEDPDGNFTVGVLDASRLIRGREYEVYYPLFVADAAIYSTTARDPANRAAPESASSQFALRFQRIRNTCTFAPTLRIPVATTRCPFFIGGPVGVCDEANDQAPDNDEVGAIMGRICAPTGEIRVSSAAQPSVRGAGFLRDPDVCVDADNDGYFARPNSMSSLAFGTRFSDCDDSDATVHPGNAETACSDGLDNDCDGTRDCADSDCRPQCPFVCRSPVECDDRNVCDGSETCVDGSCRGSLPLTCARGESCDPMIGCVSCSPEGSLRACYSGPAGTLGIGRCRGGTQRCDVGGRWLACEGQVLPALDETCGNAVDDDCNRAVDDGCSVCRDGEVRSCFTGPGVSRGVGVCSAGAQVCTSGRWGLCEGEILPQTENCLDGLDNDCDGRADCSDSDCYAQSYCGATTCGDGRCIASMGETCGTCAADCCAPPAPDAGSSPMPDAGPTCGGNLQACCPSPSPCTGMLACLSGTCRALTASGSCGGRGEPCCMPDAACDPGFVCTGSPTLGYTCEMVTSMDAGAMSADAGCTTTCTLGDVRCPTELQVEECVTGTGGCREWRRFEMCPDSGVAGSRYVCRLGRRGDPTSACVLCGGTGNPCCASRSCDGGRACQADGTCGPAPCPTGQMVCSGSCTDTTSNPLNCGACGNVCPDRPNSNRRCTASTCGYGCASPFGDCDMTSANGCETNLQTDATNCGACGNRCTAPMSASSYCNLGICAFRCNMGFGDCDMLAANGCETSLDTSAANCSACGAPCALTNAIPACMAGSCTVAGCTMGYDDCDAIPANGCERDIRSDREHCGLCGRACGATEGCVMGSCVASCSAPRMMCGPTCVDTSTDAANCGRCGHTCPGGDTCAAGICSSERIVETASGRAHTCARRASGAVACWGNNGLGQLGNGTGVDSLAPVAVSGVTNAMQLGVTAYTSCVVRSGGSASCWGDNGNGKLGDGTTTLRLAPVSLAALGGITIVEVVPGPSHTCARSSTGQVYCWGDNSNGQLGDGTTTGPRLTPGPVAGMSDAADLVLGDGFTCVRRVSGQVWCWGQNIYGELGSGATTTIPRPMPGAVVGLSDAVEVAAGGSHACARRATGQIVCWGENGVGQLGATTVPADRSATPVAVGLGPTDTVQIACGAAHTCARLSGGNVYCWGYNSTGEIGDGTMVNRTTPVLVPVGGAASFISLGDEHSCAALTTGAVMCWGNNGNGRLGDGTTVNRSLPVAVLGL